MGFLELRVPPLVLLTLFSMAVCGAGWWLPSANLPFAGSGALALAVIAAGVGVALAGVVEFRRTRTTVNPIAPGKATALVEGGVYRWTRNPMYLGMALVLLGFALWWASVPGLALVGGFCAYLTRFQILPEERVLRGLFGEPYAGYVARVRRWI
ncbi:MAG: methyltransferase family protein [Pseudomonadota bacterium]|jgi:protein-S-isoprenylcysteine O-methyltransferase Ste14